MDKEMIRIKKEESIDNEFSIKPYQAIITCLFVQTFIQLKQKYGDRYFTIEQFYNLFNQRTTIPYSLTIEDFRFVIGSIQHTGIVEENKDVKGEYRLGCINGGRGLINI